MRGLAASHVPARTLRLCAAGSEASKHATAKTSCTARMLAMANEHVSEKHFSYIPWKYRMSEERLEENNAGYPCKRAKLEDFEGDTQMAFLRCSLCIYLPPVKTSSRIPCTLTLWRPMTSSALLAWCFPRVCRELVAITSCRPQDSLVWGFGCCRSLDSASIGRMKVGRITAPLYKHKDPLVILSLVGVKRILFTSIFSGLKGQPRAQNTSIALVSVSVSSSLSLCLSLSLSVSLSLSLSLSL